jgi:hypothetical protein
VIITATSCALNKDQCLKTRPDSLYGQPRSPGPEGLPSAIGAGYYVVLSTILEMGLELTLIINRRS